MVMLFLFKFDFSLILWNLNPYVNPIIFGIIAFGLFLPLYLTSTDWALDRLGFKRWKNIHRIVYLAYIFSVLHYTQINPDLLRNPAGYLLILATVVALLFQVVAFTKVVRKTRSKKAIITGIAIILIGIILFYIAFAGILKQ